MAEVFTIEIPIEINDKTASGTVESLKAAINEMFTSAKEGGEKAKSSLSGLTKLMDSIAKAAGRAGDQTDDGMEKAGKSADKFEKRMDKTNRQLQKMEKTRIALILEAVDKATPMIDKTIGYTRGQYGIECIPGRPRGNCHD